LAAALARKGQRVLVIDLDPQAHATTHLGVEPNGAAPSMYEVLTESKPLAEVRQQLTENLWLAGSDINLAAAEMELAGVVGREVILRDLLLQDPMRFDFVLMDCAPSLGILTLNALSAASEVFIPLQPHFLALHGMSKLFETTALVAKRINPAVQISGIILCQYDANTKLTQEVVRDLHDFLGQCSGKPVPWGKARIFQTRIRRNIKLAECPSFGKSIFEYAPHCHGAADYLALAGEVLGEQEQFEVRAERVLVEEPGPVRGTEVPLPQMVPLD
jgi:chromosome partitioning protein